jgi:hypothetical protein
MSQTIKEDAKALITGLRPFSDFISDPLFPSSRNDVCAVKKRSERYDRVIDAIYLVWKTKHGSLEYENLVDSSITSDYLGIEEISENDTDIVVRVKGKYWGTPGWEKTYTRPKSVLNIQ